MHGLYRALIHNMVVGVSEGYTVKQELVGVGYRVEVKGQIVVFSLGYSHDIQFCLPNEVKAEAEPVKKGQNPVSSSSANSSVARPARVLLLNNRRSSYGID